ncbi:MAG: Lrp/AsnC family transcriptional regulator [Desulfobacterales bacterium]|nr:Lrp/AsnC family transcriptional regulator [Desulfobacterales bacterium]
MLTELEKKIIASIQGDMEITERPYQKIADDLGISQALLLDTLQGLCDRGVIRRFGATLRHQKSGYKANAMVAWQVPEERVADVGQAMAGFNQVSHCYRRDPSADWPYNLYTMVHAASETTCRETVRKMAQKTGVDRYSLLFSRQELKKTSMTYFPSDEED